jgi:predicted N-acetyltransferase YhbS
MPEHTVELIDATKHREQIISLWNKNLPGVQKDRFDWLMKGNPAGETCWFLAFSKDGEAVGMASVMPRNLHLKGNSFRAGILGDFVVDKKHRGSGMADMLLNAAKENLPTLRLEFIYTIPNNYSMKPFVRNGFNEIFQIYHMAKPISLKYYLSKYLNQSITGLFENILKCIYLAIHYEIYQYSQIFITEEIIPAEKFDVFWEKYKMQQNSLLTEHTGKYLQWRYIDNNLNKFRIAIAINKGTSEIAGYLVYTVVGNHVEIYDMLYINTSVAASLIRYVTKIAIKNSSHAIYMSIGPTNQLFPCMWKYFFFNTKYDMRFLAYGNLKLAKEPWNFFSGERNI